MINLTVNKKIKFLLISLIFVLVTSFLSWSEIQTLADSDQDGIRDSNDNCPENPNFDQLNSDSDSLGDVCDEDDDNDGVGDNLDMFDTDPTDWADFDFDGIGSLKDSDDDNDGIIDSEDPSPIPSSENLATKYLQEIHTCADMTDGAPRLVCYSQFFGMVVENEKNKSSALELSIALSKIGTIDDCHFVSHEIGHASFEQTQDVAKSLHGMDGTMCRGGYFHGVLASYFHEIKESGDSFPDSFQTICDGLIGSSNYQDCIHGLGHGLVHFFGDDLHPSVNRCNDMSFYQDILCTKGVMMQYTDDILTRQGISANVLSNLCIESELDSLDYQECSMSLGTTLAFFSDHNLEDGKIACDLIENENTQKLCMKGLQLEINDSDKYEKKPLTLEMREKYQPQFIDDGLTIDIRSPSVISKFDYSADTDTIQFLIDRPGYVIMYIPFDLLTDTEATLTLNDKIPSDLSSNDTLIPNYVAITFDADTSGMVYLGPQ